MSLTEAPQINGRRRWRLIAGLTLLYGCWMGYKLIFQPDWIANLPLLLEELLWLMEIAGAFTLVVLWIALRRPLVPKPKTDRALIAKTVDDLYALSPSEFEAYTGKIFERKGYRITLRGRSGDMGVDVELRNAHDKLAIVQCKRYRHTIGPDIVRELYGTLIHEQAAHAFLVTTADISDSARQWATGKPLTLIDGNTLAEIAAQMERAASRE